MILDLTGGIITTTAYKAFKFPGGEVHFQLTPEYNELLSATSDYSTLSVIARPNTADTFLMLCLAIDAVKKDFNNEIHVYLYYMPYQQADRDFGEGESFSLKTIANILNSLGLDSINIFDPHSDITPALLNNSRAIDNSAFIEHVIGHIAANANALRESDEQWYSDNDLTILSPDAGAYKKIFKLCEKVKFNGAIETANKYRDTKTGELGVRLSTPKFNGDVLIIDDICMGGRTFLDLANIIRPITTGNIFLAVSHGIFSNGILPLTDVFHGIYTTNSVREDFDVFHKALKLKEYANQPYLDVFDLNKFIQ